VSGGASKKLYVIVAFTTLQYPSDTQPHRPQSHFEYDEKSQYILYNWNSSKPDQIQLPELCIYNKSIKHHTSV
jgi:hypothetical protein